MYENAQRLFPHATFQAMVCGGGSVIAERTDLVSADAAIKWCRYQLRCNSNLDYGSYRIRLDDAPWTRVNRPQSV